MKRKFKRILQGILLTVLIAMNTETVQAAQLPNGVISTINTYSNGLYNIMGATTVSLGQMINYYQANESYPAFYAGTDAPDIYTFCKIYIEECAAENVRAEVAFTQAMKETGFLRFGGDVSIVQFNFAGLGATGGGNPGNSFSSVRIGIRAQVQHLKAYATSDPLNHWVVDPRYNLVNKGSAPYVEWLGKHENPSGMGWATAFGYGYSIVNDYIAKLSAQSRYSTWYNGVDYAAVYSPDYYMMNNPDVAAACGGSSDSLIRHFLDYGMREGRQSIGGFDVNSYRIRYKDLRTVFGYDLKSYYMHYMNFGKNEGRTAAGGAVLDGITVYQGVDYSAVYNYDYYVSRYGDMNAVYGMDDLAVLAHFVNYGMTEGRQGNATFDVNSYRLNYSDLRKAFGMSYASYYYHYMHSGITEGRNAVGTTTLQNPITVYNGVDYAGIYDYNYYINTYSDIRQAFGTDDEAVLTHFVTCGMQEGRQGIISFNVRSYQSGYPDLQQAFGENLMSYYIHYLQYGKAEGRTV